jgi:hypothetical protein
MADGGRRLLTAGLLAAVAAVAGAAAPPCEEGRDQTGLGLAPGDGVLAVAAVDPDTPAAAAGVRTGDVIVQVNAAVARACGDWARAVRDARAQRKALLLLVGRRGEDVAVALGAATWARTVAATPPPRLPRPEPPSVRRLVEAPRPAPLPTGTSVSVEEILAALAALAPADTEPTRLGEYRQALGRVERQVETLAARGSAPADVVTGLRTVLGYYEAAAVAWESAESQADLERRSRHALRNADATAGFFADSDVAALIDRFPFLADTVVREASPGPAAFESGGLWRPYRARALLWARGRDEAARLRAWLPAASR